MFSIFKKNIQKLVSDFAHIQVDIHSHLIPGIDDGADSIETSLELIRHLQALGYKHLITTPHVMSDLYPNTKQDILTGLGKTAKAVKAAGIDVEMGAAAGYYMDEHFEAIINSDEILALPGNRVLVEMSFVTAPPNLYHNIFRLQTKGYKPILAHPERYLFLKNDFKQYSRLKEYGCAFQLNVLSLIGHYGKPVQEVAYKLLKNNMIDYLGTDLHHSRHAELMKTVLEDKKALEILSTYEFGNNTFLEAALPQESAIKL
ncbi:MAG: histidinol phosphatase [Saprospiraceae bacterium]|nr:histidinol phosphatase [Saprospiraceae bacterium]